MKSTVSSVRLIITLNPPSVGCGRDAQPAHSGSHLGGLMGGIRQHQPPGTAAPPAPHVSLPPIAPLTPPAPAGSLRSPSTRPRILAGSIELRSNPRAFPARLPHCLRGAGDLLPGTARRPCCTTLVEKSLPTDVFRRRGFYKDWYHHSDM
jgi:hypothetical protein